MSNGVLIRCLVPVRGSRGEIQFKLETVHLRLPLKRADRSELQRRLTGYLER